MSNEIEVSIVIPCLNEADTLEKCILKAKKALNDGRISGEIIIADNGSTDGSQQIAERMDVNLVPIARKGYGNALIGGIESAKGRFIIMGDADDSYDFLEIHKFVDKFRTGDELVMGCRLPSGGGTVLKNSMPFLHRWLGNPLFSFMARHMFHAPIHDVYCGLRGFTRNLYDRLLLQCTGMEFATEMVIKSSLIKCKIGEVPITLHPDGRKAHKPHRKTFVDCWRALRFFMLYSPRWLFLLPGLFIIMFGTIGYALAFWECTFSGITLGAHTLLVSSLAVLIGHQGVIFAIMTKIYTIRERLLPEDPRFMKVFKTLTLENGLIVSSIAFITGVLLTGSVAIDWWHSGFGPLDYHESMRRVVTGVLLCALGCQSCMGSFFSSILGMQRK
jgi:glycosyltransferase involved in cell wall biosynthesis